MDDDLWDTFVTSCEVDLVEPDPAIYNYALEQTGVGPQDAFFVGHARHEIEGAAGVDLRTIAFNRDDDTVLADIVIEDFPELPEIRPSPAIARGTSEGAASPGTP